MLTNFSIELVSGKYKSKSSRKQRNRNARRHHAFNNSGAGTLVCKSLLRFPRFGVVNRMNLVLTTFSTELISENGCIYVPK
jgi:hypothetical protein